MIKDEIIKILNLGDRLPDTAETFTKKLEIRRLPILGLGVDEDCTIGECDNYGELVKEGTLCVICIARLNSEDREKYFVKFNLPEEILLHDGLNYIKKFANREFNKLRKSIPTTPDLLQLYGFRIDPESQPESGTIFARDGFQVSQVENGNEFVYESKGRPDVSTIELLKAEWLKVKGTELNMMR